MSISAAPLPTASLQRLQIYAVEDAIWRQRPAWSIPTAPIIWAKMSDTGEPGLLAASHRSDGRRSAGNQQPATLVLAALKAAALLTESEMESGGKWREQRIQALPQRIFGNISQSMPAKLLLLNMNINDIPLRLNKRQHMENQQKSPPELSNLKAGVS